MPNVSAGGSAALGLAEPGGAVTTASNAHVFPVAIGYYRHFPVLDVEEQVVRLLRLLAPFGGRHHEWVVPPRERGAGAVEGRLLEWAEAGGVAGSPGNSVLYWVGHGWSAHSGAALAHADSPSVVGTDGVTPEQLAAAIRDRQALAHARGDDETWALVIVDTCRSKRFTELLGSVLKEYSDPPSGVLLVGVSAEGATSLGRFTDALRIALTKIYLTRRRIGLLDLGVQLQKQLYGCEISPFGDLTESALVPVNPPVASFASGPLDTIRRLEEILDSTVLSADERSDFLARAQGAEHGEAPWFFEGRDQERARIVGWLRHARSGALVVTGRAGSGKSALLGDVLLQSRPDLRAALLRRGLITRLPDGGTPPDRVFDAVIHLRGLTIHQVAYRLARAAKIDLPSRTDPAAGIATDLDWLAARLAERKAPFTVLADALDEATDPFNTARSLLARIAALPGIRVLIGTRASTNERPDAPAEDSNLLDELAVDPAAEDGGCVWVGRDPGAVQRYVSRRLVAAGQRGVAGEPVPDPYPDAASPADIGRVAAAVADRDQEFLFARLAVYELAEDPWLIGPGRAWSLGNLLTGNHQALFGKAIDRLARRSDRLPVLLEALSLARGRGLPVADGSWAAIAAGLVPEISQPRLSSSGSPPDAFGADAHWLKAIDELVDRAGAYIAVESWPGDAAGSAGGDPDDNRAVGTQPEAVFRLAHHTFVEYFDAHGHLALTERRRRAAAALLDAAVSVTAADRRQMPAYLHDHLSGHVADADLWDSLADQPRVLDGLSPNAVTADAVRTLFGRRTVPAPVAGIIGARDALAAAAPADRAGLRQLSTAIHSPRQVIDEPTPGWGVAAAQAGRATIHVRLAGHTAPVNKVRSVSLPDGRLALVSASDDGTIRLWDPTTATPIGTPMAGHAGTVEDVCAFTASHGRVLLASVGGDATVRLWDPVAGQPVGEPMAGHRGTIFGVCPLPGLGADGQPLLATTGVDATVRLWDPVTGQPVGGPLAGHAGTSYAVCPLPGLDAGGRQDGRILIASAGDDSAIRIWDPVTGQQATAPLTGHRNAVFSLCPLPGSGPNGRTLLASAGGDWTVRIWDPATGQQVTEPLTGHEGGVIGVCALRGRDAGGRKYGRTLLATCGYDGTVRIWDPVARRQVAGPLTGHDGAVVGVCALTDVDSAGPPGGRILLATAGIDGTVRVWAAADGQETTEQAIRNMPARYGACALPGPAGGTLLATAGHDGTVLVWDPAAGRPAAGPLTGRKVADPLGGPGRAVRGVCPLPGLDADGRPDGRTLLASVGHDELVRIWDPAAGRAAGEPLAGHAGPVYGVCALPSPDPGGRALLASVGHDGSVRVWDPVTGQPAYEPLAGHVGPVYGVCALPSPDPGGRALLATCGYDGTLRIWDPAAGRAAGEPLTGHVGPVYGVCALPSPDPGGRALLATVGADGTARIWDPLTGRPVGEPLAESPCAIGGLTPCQTDPADCIGVADDGGVRTWTAATASLGMLPSSERVSTAVMPAGLDRGVLVTGDIAGLVDVTDLATGRVLRPRVRTGSGAVLALCPLPGRPARVAAAGRDGTITVFSLAAAHDRERVFRAHHGPVRDLCLMDRPGGSPLLVSAGNDAAIRAWDCATWMPHGDPLNGHDGWIWSITSISARDLQAPWLASAGADGTVRLWDLSAGEPVGRPLTGHAGQVRAVACATAADGRSLLISGGHDGTVRLWDPRSGGLVHAIPLKIPVQSLLQQKPTERSLARTGGGATIAVGLRTGILALDLHSSLFPTLHDGVL